MVCAVFFEGFSFTNQKDFDLSKDFCNALEKGLSQYPQDFWDLGNLLNFLFFF